jgi:hypothetical protein
MTTSQEELADKVRQMVNNLENMGMARTEAIEKVNKDLKKYSRVSSPAFVYWAVTGKYLS